MDTQRTAGQGGRRVFLYGMLAALTAAAGAALAQDAASGDAMARTLSQDKTLLQVLKAGGVMMIPLLATSVAMFTMVIISFIALQRKKLVADLDVAQLRALFTRGDYVGALAYCKGRPNFFNNTVAAGLAVLGRGQQVTEQAMGDALAKEVSVLSTRNYYLNLIGVVTPMLGLTGTVLGMIRAFSTLGESGIGDPSKLAGAIGEVLVATATGLFIAVPAFTFYYVFRNWIIGATAYAEDQINLMFRGMPYEHMAGMWFDDEPLIAGMPPLPEAEGTEGEADDGASAPPAST